MCVSGKQKAQKKNVLKNSKETRDKSEESIQREDIEMTIGKKMYQKCHK